MSKSVIFETTPKEVTEEITRFCESIVPGQKPVFVPVKPQSGAKMSYCYTNVEQHIRQYGGQQVFGWTIWQSEALLNAEFHSNWLSADGDLIDITPKADREKQILFLPDPNTVWSGTSVPNRRHIRIDDTLIRRFVEVCGGIENLLAKSGPLSMYDMLRASSLEAEKLQLKWSISRSWKTPKKSSQLSSHDRRAKRKAERQRRKKGRRRR